MLKTIGITLLAADGITIVITFLLYYSGAITLDQYLYFALIPTIVAGIVGVVLLFL